MVNRRGREPFTLPSTGPILAVSGGLTGPVLDYAVDYVQFGFTRRGTSDVRVPRDLERRRVPRGEFIVVLARTPVDVQPAAGGAEFTTVFVDPELVHSVVMWHHRGALRSRADAEAYLRRVYPGGIGSGRIGERALAEIEPLLDELVDLTDAGDITRRFHRALAIVHTVFEAITPALPTGAALLPPGDAPEDAAARPLQSLRPEVLRALRLLESELTRSWRLTELAAEVGLSPGHLRELFADSLGMTPWAYVNLLRGRKAAALLVSDRSRSIPEIMREVGWDSPAHAARMFRRHTGMTPREYRDRAS